jgi:hypothetical protein
MIIYVKQTLLVFFNFTKKQQFNSISYGLSPYAYNKIKEVINIEALL